MDGGWMRLARSCCCAACLPGACLVPGALLAAAAPSARVYYQQHTRPTSPARTATPSPTAGPRAPPPCILLPFWLLLVRAKSFFGFAFFLFLRLRLPRSIITTNESN